MADDNAGDPRVVPAGTRVSNAGFLGAPEPSADIQRSYDRDIDDLGYVMNLTRLWAHLLEYRTSCPTCSRAPSRTGR